MSEAPTGKFRVVAFLAGHDLTGRLGDLGLHVGDMVDVLANRGMGGIVLGRGDVRLALDRDSAGKVRVVSSLMEKR